MGISAGPNSISDSLAFHIDPANPRSYAGVGTVIYDLSGNGKTSYFTNGALYQNYTKGVVLVDGSDDCISTPLFTLTSPITLSAWVKNVTRSGMVFGKSGDTAEFIFSFDATNITIRINTLGSAFSFPSTNYNTWYNVVLTRDVSNNIRVYRDGIASSTVPSNSEPIRLDQIGRFESSVGANNIKGSIGEVKIYNRVLSASEVLQNYNASRKKYLPEENIVKNGLVLNIDAANPSSYSGAGTSAFDLSGFGNTATLVNGTGFGTTGGGIFVFDGVDDYIDIPNSSNLNPTRVTLSCWIKINAFTDNANLISKGFPSVDYPYVQYTLKMNTGASNNLYGFEVSNNGINASVYSGIALSLSTYFNLTATYDGSVLKIYKNGVQDPNTTSSSGLIASYATPVQLGRWGTQGSQYFNGNISQAQIYNRALSATEVMQNFNAMRERYNI